MKKRILYLSSLVMILTFIGCAKTETKKGLECSEISTWNNEEDIIKSIQGTWVMAQDDYYGKRKFQFNGKNGKSWKMEPNSNVWVEDRSFKFRYSEKYEFNTKMNQGPEYLLNFETEVGSYTFEINCISGFFVPSDRFTYGVSLLKLTE